ncbi:uncharacterized protein [Leuresthes tenuis]|uniref:uncharacterized protein n=1 Tax=Leuresthes tenuis TaxID=355514 RepID=UPI003B50D97C
MAAASKSSQRVKNVVIGVLALWSIISLVTIVVWATSPDLKGSAQCRADLQDMTEKLEGAKVVFSKDKVALEELVEEAREEQVRQRGEILVVLGRLNATNATLEECRQENVVLSGNISALQEDVEQLKEREANLTARLSLQEDLIAVLQHNLTIAVHETNSCNSLRRAAHSQMEAAQSQTEACESTQQYLQKKLQKCKVTESEAPKQTQEAGSGSTTAAPTDGAAPLAGIPALTLLVCCALHLMT